MMPPTPKAAPMLAPSPLSAVEKTWQEHLLWLVTGLQHGLHEKRQPPTHLEGFSESSLRIVEAIAVIETKPKESVAFSFLRDTENPSHLYPEITLSSESDGSAPTTVSTVITFQAGDNLQTRFADALTFFKSTIDQHPSIYGLVLLGNSSSKKHPLLQPLLNHLWDLCQGYGRNSLDCREKALPKLNEISSKLKEYFLVDSNKTPREKIMALKQWADDPHAAINQHRITPLIKGTNTDSNVFLNMFIQLENWKLCSSDTKRSAAAASVPWQEHLLMMVASLGPSRTSFDRANRIISVLTPESQDDFFSAEKSITDPTLFSRTYVDSKETIQLVTLLMDTPFRSVSDIPKEDPDVTTCNKIRRDAITFFDFLLLDHPIKKDPLVSYLIRKTREKLPTSSSSSDQSISLELNAFLEHIFELYQGDPKSVAKAKKTHRELKKYLDNPTIQSLNDFKIALYCSAEITQQRSFLHRFLSHPTRSRELLNAVVAERSLLSSSASAIVPKKAAAAADVAPDQNKPAEFYHYLLLLISYVRALDRGENMASIPGWEDLDMQRGKEITGVDPEKNELSLINPLTIAPGFRIWSPPPVPYYSQARYRDVQMDFMPNSQIACIKFFTENPDYCREHPVLIYLIHKLKSNSAAKTPSIPFPASIISASKHSWELFNDTDRYGENNTEKSRCLTKANEISSLLNAVLSGTKTLLALGAEICDPTHIINQHQSTLSEILDTPPRTVDLGLQFCAAEKRKLDRKPAAGDQASAKAPSL